MIEVPPPNVLITENAITRARELGYGNATGNAKDWGKLAEVTNSVTRASAGVAIMLTHGGKFNWQQDKSPVYTGDFSTPVDADQLAQEKQRTIRIDMYKRPFTESYISQTLCAELQRSEERKDFYRKFLPGTVAGLAGGTTVATSVVLAIYEYEPVYPITAVGGILLGIGWACRYHYNDAARPRELLQYGGAPLLSPVELHSAQTTAH